MNRLKSIKSIAEFKELILLHKESIKKAALPVTVVAALLFFWISGEMEKKEVVIEENGITNEAFDEGLDVDALVSEDMAVSETSEEIYVDIGGCVYNPGVYKVSQGTRLFEVIEKAGGLTEDADTNNLNRAEAVYDGQKILIYSVNNEAIDGETTNSVGNGTTVDNTLNVSQGKININTADFDKLQEIPGVGPSTAQKIIDYRQNVSRFSAIEDIKNVSGIGDKTFENMKEYITV